MATYLVTHPSVPSGLTLASGGRGKMTGARIFTSGGLWYFTIPDSEVSHVDEAFVRPGILRRVA